MRERDYEHSKKINVQSEKEDIKLPPPNVKPEYTTPKDVPHLDPDEPIQSVSPIVSKVKTREIDDSPTSKEIEQELETFYVPTKERVEEEMNQFHKILREQAEMKKKNLGSPETHNQSLTVTEKSNLSYDENLLSQPKELPFDSESFMVNGNEVEMLSPIPVSKIQSPYETRSVRNRVAAMKAVNVRNSTNSYTSAKKPVDSSFNTMMTNVLKDSSQLLKDDSFINVTETKVPSKTFTVKLSEFVDLSQTKTNLSPTTQKSTIPKRTKSLSKKPKEPTKPRVAFESLKDIHSSKPSSETKPKKNWF